MAELDRKIADEAYKAFAGEDGNLDEWAAEVDSASPEPSGETGKEEAKEEEPGETAVPPGADAGDDGPAEDEKPETETKDETKDEKPVPETAEGMSKVDLINSRLTREQAKKLTLPLYDDFGDVVCKDGIRPERLAEYTSVIPYWYKSYKDGTEKMGTLPKYPRFLARFGATEASSISMTAVLKEFAPELHDQFMDADRDAECLAKSASIIIAKRGLDFSRKLVDDDYDIMEKNGVKNPRKYKTVAEITGMNTAVMDVDPDIECVYNPDYADAMERMVRGETDDAGAEEVVSLESVMGNLDPKIFKGFMGQNASDVKELSPGDAKEEAPEPFMPFSSGKPAEPGRIFQSMQKQEKKDTSEKPW